MPTASGSGHKNIYDSRIIANNISGSIVLREINNEDQGHNRSKDRFLRYVMGNRLNNRA